MKETVSSELKLKIASLQRFVKMFNWTSIQPYTSEKWIVNNFVKPFKVRVRNVEVVYNFRQSEWCIVTLSTNRDGRGPSFFSFENLYSLWIFV